MGKTTPKNRGKPVERVRVEVRFAKKTLKLLDSFAKREKASRSAVVEAILVEALD